MQVHTGSGKQSGPTSHYQHKTPRKAGLQALAIPRVLHLASIRGLASSRARIAITTTLSPTRDRLLRTSTARRLGRRRHCGLGGSGGRVTCRVVSDLAGPEGSRHSRSGVRRLSRGVRRLRSAGGVRRLSGQHGANTGPCGLLVEVAVIECSIAVLDPVVFVDVAPDGDADAAGDVQAGADHVGIVITLLGEGGGGGGDRLVRDVELGVGDFDAESGEALEEVGHGGARGRAADLHMGLETDTVNGGAGGFDELDELEGPFGLGAVVLEVVVVVVAGRC